MSNCLVIAVDGLDGSGKTIIVETIKQHFIRNKVPLGKILTIKALGQGPVGSAIRSSILFKDEFTESHESLYVATALIELFCYELNELKKQYDVIIIDRYISSYYAYQVATNRLLAKEIYKQHLTDTNNLLTIPDIFFYLKINPKQSVINIEKRGNLLTVSDRFDSKEVFEKMTISNGFDEYFVRSNVKLKYIIDSNKSMNSVKNSVVKYLQYYHTNLKKRPK